MSERKGAEMSHDEKLPLSVGSALERERERMVRLRVSKEMPPAKPTIDEQIEGQENFIAKLDNPNGLRIGKGILSTLRAHKAIMEAKRPEPKIITCGSCGLPEMVGRSDYMKLLAYADRMAAELDAQIGCTNRALTRHKEACQRAETVERQLGELQAKHDALVKDAERYRKAVIDLAERGYVRRPKWLVGTIDAAMSAVALESTKEEPGQA